MSARLALLILVLPHFASAAPALPYTTRTQGYSALSTTIQGDIRTVGMAGATVGLADTYMASADNPAGLAYTLSTGDLNFTSNIAYDEQIQSYDAGLRARTAGGALNVYPWGASIGVSVPYSEGRDYAQGNVLVRMEEFRFGVARLLENARVSVGLQYTLSRADRTLSDREWSSSASGLTLGLQYVTRKRQTFGASFSTDREHAGDLTQSSFYRRVHVPWKLGGGAGLIPNRFFRADATLFLFGASEGTALIRDDRILTGRALVLQPRLGATYVFADYWDLRGTLYAGTYFEITRISGGSNRLHLTGGIELKPAIFALGAGFDLAQGYRNYLITIGLDPVRSLEWIGILPKLPRPRPAGLLPDFKQESDQGLPRPLVENWTPDHDAIDALETARQIPARTLETGKKAVEFIESIPEKVRNSKTRGEGAPIFAPKPEPSPQPTLKTKKRRSQNVKSSD